MRSNTTYTGLKCMLKNVFVAFFVLVILAIPASAADYYVSPSGNDGSSGSFEQPWSGISYAVSQAEPGDTVYLMEGTWYNEHIVFPGSGTAAEPITLTVLEGANVVLDGVDSTGDCFFADSKSYLTISGMNIRNYARGFAFYQDTSDVELSNFALNDVRSGGVVFYGETSPLSSITNIVITDFTMEDMGDDTANNHACVEARYWFSGSENIEISNFEINRSTLAGICIREASNVHVHDGQIYDIISKDYLDGINFGDRTRDSIIENVTINRTSWHGIGLQESNDHIDGKEIENVTIRNVDISYPVHNAVDFQTGAFNCTLENFVLHDYYGSFSHGLQTHLSCDNITIRNGVIHGFTKGMMFYQPNNHVYNVTVYDIPAANPAVCIMNEDVELNGCNIIHEGTYPVTVTAEGLGAVINATRVGVDKRISFQTTSGVGTVQDVPDRSYYVDTKYGAQITVQYTNGQIFSDNKGMGVNYYPQGSKCVITGGAWVHFEQENFGVLPESGYLYDVNEIDPATVSLRSSLAENPTTISLAVENASHTYNIYRDGELFDAAVSDEDSVLRYVYSDDSGNDWNGAHTFHIEYANASSGQEEPVEEEQPVVQNEESMVTVTASPSALIVTPGESFNVDIELEPMVPVTGAQFDLDFNAVLANVNAVNEGNMFNQQDPTLFSEGMINNVAGTVTDVYCSILGSSYALYPGTMATVAFIAGSDTGYLDIDLSDIVVSDTNSMALAYDAVNTTILVDTAPVMGSLENRTVTEAEALEFDITANDVDGDTLSYTASSLPEGATFGTTGAFSWTPAVGQAGTYSVDVVVSDGYLNDTGSLSIEVLPANHAPVMNDISDRSVDEESTLAFSVSGTDEDGDALSYTASGLPEGASFNEATFSWAPEDGQAGSYTVSFTVSDGQLNDTVTMNIQVVEVNHAPVMGALTDRSVDEESTLTFSVSATDVDGDVLNYSVTGLPEGASFNEGTFSWTPADGQAGLYTLNFTVSDGEFTDSVSMNIQVVEINHAPVIDFFGPADGSNYDEGESIDLSATGSDVDGDTLSYLIKIDGVTYSTGAEYTWVTDYSSAGTHVVEFIVSDGEQTTSTQITITINDVHPRWDVNEDGVVNILDITMISQRYGNTVSTPYPRWDVNQDGVINIQDLTMTSYHFGEQVE